MYDYKVGNRITYKTVYAKEMVEEGKETSSNLETPNEMRCFSSKEYCRGRQIRERASEKLLAEAPGKGQMGKGIKADRAAVLIRQ